MSEERLENIESKLALVEHTVDELNKTIYDQQKQIDQLHALVESLASHVRDLKETAGERPPANERPPHY